MSAISIVPVPQALVARGESLPLDAASGARAGERLHQAATAFEALFLRSLLRQMLEAQLDNGLFGEGAGSAVYQGMFVDHLAEQLADGAPLGIAGLVESQWAGSADPAERDTAAALARARKIEASRAYEDGARPDATPAKSEAERPAAPEPPAAPATADDRAARVSSPWGWRRDPLDGRRRFHGGIDLPAPTGTPVRSVADGRVVGVARNGGYGLQVTLDHGQGWTTSYAHLSEASVSVGDAIRRGVSLGRVGSSGRATGPHLHLETVREGIRQDPAVLLGGQLGAQVLGLPADNEIGD